MTTELADIKEKAMALPEAEREALTHDLLDSLPMNEQEATELAEWDRRLSELKDGREAGLSLEAFRREVGHTRIAVDVPPTGCERSAGGC